MNRLVNLEKLQLKYAKWRKENFPEIVADKYKARTASALGVAEESGELCSAVIRSEIRGKDMTAEIKDAIGDVTMYLIAMCNDYGFDYETIILEASDTVLKRRYLKQGVPE